MSRASLKSLGVFNTSTIALAAVAALAGALSLESARAKTKSLYSGVKACDDGSGDPFQPLTILPAGRDAGKCIDTSWNRFPKLVKSPINQSKDVALVANFRHKDKFWIAYIPYKGLAQAVWQIETFSSGLLGINGAHTQLKISMSKDQPILLFPQDKATADKFAEASESDLASISEKPAKIYEFIVSYNHGAAKNVPFAVVPGGIQELFTISPRLVSARDVFVDQVLTQGHQLRQIALKADQAQLERLVKRVIFEAAYYEQERTYNTFDQECVTLLFDLIDRVLIPTQSPKPFRVSVMQAFSFVQEIKNSLAKRGLVKKTLPDWDVEFREITHSTNSGI